MRNRILVFVAVAQSLLFLTHFFVYATIVFFWPPLPLPALDHLRVAFLLLSLSFLPATLLAFRFYNVFIRAYYILAALWIGLLNFLILGAALCWIIYPVVLLLHLPISRSVIGAALCLEAVILALYGVINAASLRLTRVTVRLPNLPPSWRGRTAAMLSDTHLGHVHNRRFLLRIIGRLRALRPDVIFFCGDMFDGTQIDAVRAVEPWRSLVDAIPFGIFFATGNHEEFGRVEQLTSAIAGAGIRVLRNEKVEVDGLQILGVYDHDSHSNLAAVLDRIVPDPARASILLLHEPVHLDLSEQRGISLQLSGHTHGGQIFPSTWITRRIFRAYTYGLHPFRKMLVYTSYGAGTWGPPLRVGTWPEIVLIRFE